MKIELVSWDLREGLDPVDLVAVINRMEHGPVYARKVETGTDHYMVALSDQPVTQAEAMQAWRAQFDD